MFPSFHLLKYSPKSAEVLASGGDIVALVKPQFEGTPKEVPGGFVRDESTRQLIIARAQKQIESIRLYT